MDDELRQLIDLLDATIAPPDEGRPGDPRVAPVTVAAPAAGDQRSGEIYRMAVDLGFAVKVALTTGRPLLLTGAPGSGKSSLAPFLARLFHWRFYDEVLTSKTEANDLLWRFDNLRKLSDATDPNRRGPLVDRRYVDPGVLWWAFAPDTARDRGLAQRPATDPNGPLNAERASSHAVVLLDEIDKADPDVPNALLVALGSFEFTVTETDQQVALAGDEPRRVLVVITSNGERSLPPAFIRRCIAHQLAQPDEERLVEIARLHAAGQGKAMGPAFEQRVRLLAKRTVAEALAAGSPRRSPGTAEFLDAVRAAAELGLSDGDEQTWNALINLTISKAELRR